jgi:hypothetical protein
MRRRCWPTRSASTYQRTFGSCEPRFTEVIEASARLTIERIVGSDAPYHDGDHTALVTLVAQDILRGRFLDKGITPEDWLHMILAALSHDIGYVRGVCSGNRANAFVIDAQGTTIGLPRGASDAALAPCPSSDDLRRLEALRNGGSGPSG